MAAPAFLHLFLVPRDLSAKDQEHLFTFGKKYDNMFAEKDYLFAAFQYNAYGGTGNGVRSITLWGFINWKIRAFAE